MKGSEIVLKTNAARLPPSLIANFSSFFVAGFCAVTTGASTIKAIERARAEGLEVQGAFGLVDRLEGGADAITGDEAEHTGQDKHERHAEVRHVGGKRLRAHEQQDEQKERKEELEPVLGILRRRQR